MYRNYCQSCKRNPRISQEPADEIWFKKNQRRIPPKPPPLRVKKVKKPLAVAISEEYLNLEFKIHRNKNHDQQ